MGRVAAIGEATRLEALRLAGVLVLPAADPVEAHDRWRALPDDVTLVLLTEAAGSGVSPPRPGVLTVVMPT